MEMERTVAELIILLMKKLFGFNISRTKSIIILRHTHVFAKLINGVVSSRCAIILVN